MVRVWMVVLCFWCEVLCLDGILLWYYVDNVLCFDGLLDYGLVVRNGFWFKKVWDGVYLIRMY